MGKVGCCDRSLCEAVYWLQLIMMLSLKIQLCVLQSDITRIFEWRLFLYVNYIIQDNNSLIFYLNTGVIKWTVFRIDHTLLNIKFPFPNFCLKISRRSEKLRFNSDTNSIRYDVYLFLAHFYCQSVYNYSNVNNIRSKQSLLVWHVIKQFGNMP